MPPVRRVSFQDILTDIRSGMSQIRLLEKYDLTPKLLLGVFDKLIKQDRFTMEEYKSWEARQKPPSDEPDREKPLPPKPTAPEPTIAEAASSADEHYWADMAIFGFIVLVIILVVILVISRI